MNKLKPVFEVIDRVIGAKQVSNREALELLEELKDDVQSRIEALRTEIERQDV